MKVRIAVFALLIAVPFLAAHPEEGQPVLATDALITHPAGGLENTGATAESVSATGQLFARALRVTIRKPSAETNATQLTLPNAAPVHRGDVLLATFSIRGAKVGGGPARVQFLFEKAMNPWTKSATFDATTPRDPSAWKVVKVPFAAAEAYQPSEAMASFRLAFGPQTVELGGVSLVNYGTSRKLSDLIESAISPLGTARVTVNLKATKQTLMGFGGDFCGPRYGATTPFDPVARYNIQNLQVRCARVGLPLNHWVPEPGVYKDEGPAHACLLQMQSFKRRGLPLIVSVWEGPLWMLGGKAEQNGRKLPRDKYGDCIEAVGRFLVTARDKYGAEADYFSFNEADMGINFLFPPADTAEFIRQAGPRFQALGLKTKFLVGDTGNGAGFVRYAPPLLDDPALAQYLGPCAFHCWDALGAADSTYEQVAAIGRKYNKPIWCTEAGWDAGLWQRPNPWESWENALRTAAAYEKTLRLTAARVMLYWTYEDDYPLVSKDGSRPYPVWHVMKQMQDVFRPNWRIATATSTADDLHALPAVSANGRDCALLLVNVAGDGRVSVTGLPPSTTVTILTSTAAAQRQSSTARTDKTGKLTISVPALSATTLTTVVK
jgi:O-glycosyl hydrolase